MNPSVEQLIVSSGTKDRSTSQGVPKSGKKLSKGKQNDANLFNIIGGAGSFASIMKQKETVISMNKTDQGKEGSVQGQRGLTAVKEDMKEGLTGIKAGRRSLSQKVAKEGDSKKIASGDPTPLEKNITVRPEVVASGETSEVTMKGKKLSGKIGKSQSSGGERSFTGGDALTLPDAFLTRDVDNPQIKSAMEKGNTLSLKQGVSGFDNIDTLHFKDTISPDSERRLDVKALSGNGLKSTNLAKKNVSGGVSNYSAGGEIETQHGDGGPDIAKELNIKDIHIGKVSSDPKEQEIVLKDNRLRQEGVKENPIFTKQVNTASEKTESYKEIFSAGFNELRSVEQGMNEPPVAKTDALLWTTNTDFSGAKGIWSVTGTNAKGDSALLQFQDVIGQIEEGAANMFKKGSDRIVITLEPPTLGTLNMDVRVNNDTVKMVLIADNYEVKQVLNSNLDQLKTALQNQGLTMDHFDVFVQERSYDGNQGFQPGGGALFDEGKGRRGNAKEDNSPLQVLTPGGSEVSDPSLGVISLFA